MRPRHFCGREDDRRLCGERSEVVLTEHEVCGLRVHHAKDRREEVVVGRNMVMKQEYLDTSIHKEELHLPEPQNVQN